MINLLILLIIYLFIRLQDMKIENKNLKVQLELYKKGEVFNLQQEIKTEIKTETKVISEKERIEIIKKKEIKDKEIKNTCILLVGAMLIIMAAIVFLMSTWSVINNIFKTAVLILLVGVFMGASKVAKEKFKLTKASTTFFYIGMAYIPISLLSISILGLFGDYLSITGEGNYLYLSISALIIALVYYTMYKKNNDKSMFYGSILTQTITAILFSCIFDTKIEYITMSLLLYNFLLMLLIKNHEQKKVLEKLYYIIPYTTLFLTTMDSSIETILTPLSYILSAINLFIIDLKKDNKITGFFFTLLLNLIGIYFINKNSLKLNINDTILYITCNFAIVYLLIMLLNQFIKKKNFDIGSNVFSLLMINIIYFGSFDVTNILIAPWIYAASAVVILLLNYKKVSEKLRKLISIFIPVYFIISGINLLAVLVVSYHFYLLLGIATFIIGQTLIPKNMEDLKKYANFFSHILLIIVYIVSMIMHFNNMNNIVIYYIILLAIYCYSYFTTKFNLFKYASYLVGHVLLNSIFVFLGVADKSVYVLPMIMTIIIMYFENKKTKYLLSEIFLSIYKIVAYAAIMNLNSIFGITATLAFTAYIIYDNRINKNSNDIIPLIGVVGIVFNYSVDSMVIGIIMLLFTLATTLLSFESKRMNLYTMFSAIYLLISLQILSIEYLNEIIFITWSFTNYYILEKESDKDKFKFLTGIGLVFLYNLIVVELGLDFYTAFNMLGIIALAIVTIRKILNKYIKEIDIIECITFIILYVIAFNNYTSETDGMVFMILLCGIIILSYIKKYGMLFCVTIITIILNVLLLTREFWLSIPWWIYLLLIGSILITFAIRNEANEKSSITDTIKGLKDKIDNK